MLGLVTVACLALLAARADEAPPPEVALKTLLPPPPGCTPARHADEVEVTYRAWANGEAVDENGSLSFTLGVGMVIEGFDRTVDGMCAGEVREAVVPAEMAYGPAGFEGVAPDSDLIFVIEVKAIVRRAAAER